MSRPASTPSPPRIAAPPSVVRLAVAGAAGKEGPLVGRDADLGVLLTFLRDAAAGRGGALVLSGEPGIGKSVLLDAAVADAAGAGTRVLRTTGQEFQVDAGWSTLGRLLGDLPAHPGRLEPAHREALRAVLGTGTTGDVDRLMLYNAVLALLRDAAAERPLLLVVDDVQWADRATAALLGFVARRLAGTRVGLLAAVRPGVEGFFARSGLPTRPLHALSDAESAALVRTRFPTLGPAAVRRVLDEARGNPLALLELPAALSEPQRTGGHGLPATLPLSHRLRAMFGSRVEQLPAPTRDLLLLAAFEAHGDLTLLLRSAGGAAGLADLVPAERAGLVTVDRGGRRLAFRHPLTGATVVECSTLEERISAHRRLAEALAGEPERRIWHLAAATVGPDEQVARELTDTAVLLARRGDAVGALRGLLRAADLSPDGDSRARRLTEAAYAAAGVNGELHRAAVLLVEARQGDRAVQGSLRAATAAAYLLLNGDGDVAMAHRLLVGAVLNGAAEPDGDEQALTEALQVLLVVCLHGGRPELWPPFHDALRRLPSPPPMLRLLVSVLAGYADLTAADVAELDAAVDGLSAETDPTRIGRVAIAALFLDRARGCREALWRLVADGRAGGAVAAAITALQVLAADDVLTGQWDEAAALAEEGLALCDGHGYGLLRWPFRLVQAVIAANTGDEPRRRELVAEMDGWGDRVGSVRHYARYSDALAALGAGDAERAYQALLHINAAPGTLPFGVPVALWTGLDLTEAAVATGRRAEAAAHARALHTAGVADLSAHLALLAAGAAAVAAADADADALFAGALAVPGGDRWPFDRARVQLAYGEHLHRTRQPGAARAQLVAAHATFDRLGARPWADRAAAALRAAGRPTAVPAGSGLTAQERRIAELAAAGLTNREIGDRLLLSHRTVGGYLRRIFRKLGITSRTALHAALTAPPPPDGQARR